MRYCNIKLKKIKIIFIHVILLSLISGSNLKGMDNIFMEEEVHLSLHTQPLLPANIDDEESRPTQPLLSGNIDEENTLGRSTNNLSRSYVLAFQDDSEKGFSKYLIFKYIVCLVGAVGPIIPQMVIPQLIGQEYGSETLGYALTATTILTIEGIASWMIWELIDDTEKLVKSARHHQITNGACNLQSAREIGIGVLSLILGAFSSVPDVYKTYKYNTIKEFAIISAIYDTIPHTIGFYKLLSSLSSKKVRKLCNKDNTSEQQGVRLVELSKAYFLKKCKEEGTETVSTSLSNLHTAREVCSYLTSDMEHVEGVSPQYFARGIPRKVVQLLAIIPPLTTAAGLSMVLAYNGYSLLIDDEASLISLSIFSVLPAFLLNTYVLTQAAGDLFDKIYSCRSKTPSTDYFTSFHPEINGVFIFTALVLGTASSVSGFYLIVDNLKDTILSPVKYLVASLAVGTDLTFGTYTVYSVMKRYGEAIKKKVGRGTSYIFNCLKKLRNVGDSIVNSSLEAVNSFVEDLSHQEEALN